MVGLYEFNGNLANSISGGSALGSLTVLNAGGATTGYSSGAWTWSGATNSPGTGLKLDFGSTLSTYSIGMVFQYTQVDGYRKVLDFVGGATDAGIYVDNGVYESCLTAGAQGGNIAANTFSTFVITREATGHFTVYVDGSPTTVMDETALSGELAGQTVQFFLDDGGSEFTAGGSVAEIRVWNTALSSGDIPTAFAAIPEPATYALLLGAAGLALAAWRRRAGRV
jgi:hypothetical protein